MECSSGLWNVAVTSGMLWSLLECCGSFWNFPVGTSIPSAQGKNKDRCFLQFACAHLTQHAIDVRLTGNCTYQTRAYTPDPCIHSTLIAMMDLDIFSWILSRWTDCNPTYVKHILASFGWHLAALVKWILVLDRTLYLCTTS